MTRLQFYHLEKLCEEHGPAVKSGEIWYLLLSLDCRQILVPVSLLHRFRSTHQEHLQVQQKCEVMVRHRETGAIHQ